MLAKCANPSCPTRFHRFNEGKLFRLSTSDRKEEYFWLCGKCSATNTLVVDVNGQPQVKLTSDAGLLAQNSGSASQAYSERFFHSAALHAKRGSRHGMRQRTE
jgi:hypothetical protein